MEISVKNNADALIFHTIICAENVTNKPLSDKRELQCGRIAAFAAFSCGFSNVNVLGMEI